MRADLDAETGQRRAQAAETKGAKGRGTPPHPPEWGYLGSVRGYVSPGPAAFSPRGRRGAALWHGDPGDDAGTQGTAGAPGGGEARSPLVWPGLPWEGENGVIPVPSAAEDVRVRELSLLPPLSNSTNSCCDGRDSASEARRGTS